jgi:hypothetical protein
MGIKARVLFIRCIDIRHGGELGGDIVVDMDVAKGCAKAKGVDTAGGTQRALITRFSR